MQNDRPKIAWFLKVLMLCSISMMALFFVGMVLFMIFRNDINSVKFLTYSTVAQNLLIFILPVVLLAIICKKLEGRPMLQTMWMTKGPSFKSILLVVTVWIVALPAMNYIVEWNKGIEFPTWMKFLEDLFRQMEDSATLATSSMLDTHSLGMMLAMVFVVGILAGFGEEMFFRAGLLGSMRFGGLNKHVAVWVAAFIFSAIHMQFYGFVPRLLLGAWFGYLMLWSGEMWTPFIAHALNNGAIVVVTYLANINIISSNFIDTIGTDNRWIATGSAMATALVIALFMRKRKDNNKIQEA